MPLSDLEDLKVQGKISKLGGLSKEYSILKHTMAMAFANTLPCFRLRTTRGVLLHGPPGTGKTFLARLCAYDAGVNFFSLNGHDIINQYYGESEQALNKIFESAMRATPSVVFIDELDAIVPARNDGAEALSQRIVYTLGNLMGGIGKTDRFIVIAATNRLDTIEPALRKLGRFEREIEIGVPSPEQRLDILLALLSEMRHSLLDSQVRHLAVVTHGFVGADLAALCNEAAMVPKVKWKDVGGQKEVKRQLMEAVEWPQKHQDAFERIGIRPPTGVLLFGPPGCSKTLIARAIASEAGLSFLDVKGLDLFTKWVGESEKAVRSLFAKARANAPSIIFFDEIDGLAIIRGEESEGVSVSDRVVNQLLTKMDGLHQSVNVTVIAATNRPDKIDPALLRPGRFDRLLYVGLPNKIDREEIFCIHLRKIPCSTDVNVGELADLTKGCTGADISFICQEAALAALEVAIEEILDLEASEVTMQQLKTAIELVKPSETDFSQELSTKFQRLVSNNVI